MAATLLNAARARDRSRHAAPQVFEQLREMILSLALAPGTVLSRSELQQQFRLSSTPIRDALLQLQDEHLVEIFPQHATVVSPIDLALARQAQFLRRSVELEIVRTLAASPDKALVARLNAIVAQQRVFADAGDLEQFMATDQSFHQAMYEAAQVPDLWALVRRHSGHIDRLRRLHLPVEGKAEQIVDDHTAIVDAIASGKPEIAQRQLRDHLSRSLAFSSEMRTRFPTYFRD
jgi:GntR family transcriptional regulator, rspAB operon transcriptional repressor